MVDFTTTYTTITTFMRFALDNDALRRVVAVAIRRARRVRRGYIKSSEAAKNLASLFTARGYSAEYVVLSFRCAVVLKDLAKPNPIDSLFSNKQLL